MVEHRRRRRRSSRQLREMIALETNKHPSHLRAGPCGGAWRLHDPLKVKTLPPIKKANLAQAKFS